MTLGLTVSRLEQKAWEEFLPGFKRSLRSVKWAALSLILITAIFILAYGFNWDLPQLVYFYGILTWFMAGFILFMQLSVVYLDVATYITNRHLTVFRLIREYERDVYNLEHRKKNN